MSHYMPSDAPAAGTRTPLTAYQKQLMVFLSVATFFEGYDMYALSQLLPTLREEMHLSPEQGGLLVSVINIGTILAYFLVRQADVWGRRRVLTITIAGYTLFSLATGFTHDPYSFGLCQLLARIFLIAEWAISMVYAAEEFPADRRGMAIGVIQACAALGSILCAAVVPMLLKTSFGWRSVYFVGAIPLVLTAIARRSIQETKRFENEAREGHTTSAGLFHIFSTPYRTRVLQLSLIWALTYACTQNAILFWKEYAMSDLKFTHEQVGHIMTIAAIASLPLLFGTGKLLDVIGRRKGAAVIFTSTAVAVFMAYTLKAQIPLTIAVIFSIFGVSAVLPVLNAFTSELFPTHLRSDAFAWSNNLLGRISAVLSPTLIGIAAERTSWGTAVASTTFFPILALGLILLLLPETNKRELEETSALT